jgi:hypothetical protein
MRRARPNSSSTSATALQAASCTYLQYTENSERVVVPEARARPWAMCSEAATTYSSKHMCVWW